MLSKVVTRFILKHDTSPKPDQVVFVPKLNQSFSELSHQREGLIKMNWKPDEAQSLFALVDGFSYSSTSLDFHSI